MKHINFYIMILIFGTAAILHAETQITRHAITWTLAENYEHGTFTNGDPWVKEPSPGAGITITFIDPKPQNTSRFKNGTMINISPSNGQAFDETGAGFNPELILLQGEQDFPLYVSANSSVVSTISLEPAQTRPSISDASVLTVLPYNTSPMPGDFRPPYVGTDKTLKWNADEINWGSLPAFNQPASTPNPDEVIKSLERLWLLNEHTSRGRSIHPSNNMREYGRDLSKDLQTALLTCLTDIDSGKKRRIATEIVQKGIDIFGCLENGMNYPANGGHNQGMKAPLLFAGWILNDNNILWWSDKENYDGFQEDESTFYVSEAEIEMTNSNDWRPDDRAFPVPYLLSDIGMPEWGIRHDRYAFLDNKNWKATYRNTTGSATIGHALCIMLLGLNNTWNNEAFFDYYTNRYYPIMLEHDSGNFTRDMWASYGPTPNGKQLLPPIISPSDDDSFISSEIEISIESPSPDTMTYYTTEDSHPSTDSNNYSTSFNIYPNPSALVIAYSVKQGLYDSPITIMEYHSSAVTPISPSNLITDDGGN